MEHSDRLDVTRKAYKVIGSYSRAKARLAILNYRVNNPTKRNKCYAGVKVLIDEYDFIRWFRKHDFEGCSVDRIDNEKHYEVGNLKLIPMPINAGKDKLIACEGVTRCYSCKKVKPLEEFVKDKRISTGRTTICKPCEVQRTTLRNNKRNP